MSELRQAGWNKQANRAKVVGSSLSGCLAAFLVAAVLTTPYAGRQLLQFVIVYVMSSSVLVEAMTLMLRVPNKNYRFDRKPIDFNI